MHWDARTSLWIALGASCCLVACASGSIITKHVSSRNSGGETPLLFGFWPIKWSVVRYCVWFPSDAMLYRSTWGTVLLAPDVQESYSSCFSYLFGHVWGASKVYSHSRLQFAISFPKAPTCIICSPFIYIFQIFSSIHSQWFAMLFFCVWCKLESPRVRASRQLLLIGAILPGRLFWAVVETLDVIVIDCLCLY